MRPRAPTLVLVVAAAAGLAGCGGEDDAAKGAAPPAQGAGAAGQGAKGGYEVVELEKAGAIVATVRLSGAVPKLLPIAVRKDQDTCHSSVPDMRLVVEPKEKGVQYAQVSLPDVRRGRSFATVDRTLDQRGCLFEPHVQVMTIEGRLTITNSDPIAHNTQIVEEAFNETQLPGANPRVKQMKRLGRIKVACNLHEWMTAYVIVADNPYVGVTDNLGKVELTDVPVGKHVLEVWHEYLAPKGKRVDVEVKEGEPAKVIVELAAPE